jgi:hypothetical protein
MRRKISIPSVVLFLIFGTIGLSESAMTTCDSTCSKGSVYLTIPSNLVTPNKTAVGILQSDNDYSTLLFSVQVLATKEIVINLQFTSTEDSPDGIASSVNSKLRPYYLRRNELKPLVLFFNASAVCVLFQNDCLSECSRIPTLVTSISGFLKTPSTIGIESTTEFTNNRTSVFLATDNCKQILFAEDIGYYNSFKNGLNSAFSGFFNILKDFGLYSSS